MAPGSSDFGESEGPLEFQQWFCSSHVKCSSHVSGEQTLDSRPRTLLFQCRGVCDFLQLVTNLWVTSCHRLGSLQAGNKIKSGMQDIYHELSIVGRSWRKQNWADGESNCDAVLVKLWRLPQEYLECIGTISNPAVGQNGNPGRAWPWARCCLQLRQALKRLTARGCLPIALPAAETADSSLKVVLNGVS